MRLYWGDYLRDTTDLTATEHGAYLLLIGSLWSRGTLPFDERILRTIARCTAKQWKSVWPRIAGFFVIHDGAISQPRVDRERQAAGLGRKAGPGRPKAQRAPAEPPDEAATPSGGLPAAPSRGLPGESSPPTQPFEKGRKAENNNQNHIQNHKEVENVSRGSLFPPQSHSRARARAASEPEPSLFGEASTSPEPQAREAPPSPPPDAPPPEPAGNVVAFAPRAVALREPAGFNEFWKIYPRKTSKGAARTAWERAVRKVTAGEIIGALRDRLAHFPDEARFVPHPATWLNQERWTDEIASLRAIRESRPPTPAEEMLAASGITKSDLDEMFGPAPRRTNHGN
jgi:uncharacterized protein YdaU (DUF1376 family)